MTARVAVCRRGAMPELQSVECVTADEGHCQPVDAISDEGEWTHVRSPWLQPDEPVTENSATMRRRRECLDQEGVVDDVERPGIVPRVWKRGICRGGRDRRGEDSRHLERKRERQLRGD